MQTCLFIVKTVLKSLEQPSGVCVCVCVLMHV